MKMIQVLALAMGVAAVTAGSNAGLRRGAPLATDATVSSSSAADLVAKQAADNFLHLLAKDEKKAHDDKEKKEKHEKHEKKNSEKNDKEDKEEKKEDKKEEADVEAQEFVAACLVHTGELVQRIDGSYTDIQFQTVLENECLLSKEFPLTYDSGFDSHKACMSFAEALTDARHAELADGSTEGYAAFCQKFWTTEVEPKRKKKESLEAELEKDIEEAEGFILSMGGNSTWLILLILACCLCGILACVFQNRKSRPSNA